MKITIDLTVSQRKKAIELPKVMVKREHTANPFDVSVNAHYFLFSGRAQFSALEAKRDVALQKYLSLAPGWVVSLISRICIIQDGQVVFVNRERVCGDQFSWDERDEFRIFSNKEVVNTGIEGTSPEHTIMTPVSKSIFSWFSYVWNSFDDCLAYAKEVSIRTGNVLMIGSVEERIDRH